LVVAAPLLAFDLHSEADRRWLELFIAITGILAALSFFTYWVTLRDFIHIGSGDFLLPYFYLSAAFVSYAAAAALHGDSRPWWWLGAAIAVFVLMLFTGTRATFLLLAIPVALMVFTSIRWRLVVPILLVTAVGLVGWVVLAPSTGLSGSQASERIKRLSDPGRDESLAERIRESKVAFRSWKSAPAVGVGAGHEFTWRAPRGQGKFKTSYILDSPAGFLAKFGLLGVIGLAVAILGAARFVRQRRNDPDTVVGANALIAFGAVSLVGLSLGFPMEDKGFGLGLLILLALALPKGLRDREQEHGVPFQAEREAGI
jgi:cell division protein FtsW (lipid II flippase)